MITLKYLSIVILDRNTLYFLLLLLIFNSSHFLLWFDCFHGLIKSLANEIRRLSPHTSLAKRIVIIHAFKLIRSLPNHHHTSITNVQLLLLRYKKLKIMRIGTSLSKEINTCWHVGRLLPQSYFWQLSFWQQLKLQSLQ